MREVIVKLKLTSGWMGNPVGSIIKVGERQARSMVSRKIAKIVDEERSEPVKVTSKMQRRDRDKMIRSSGVIDKRLRG